MTDRIFSSVDRLIAIVKRPPLAWLVYCKPGHEFDYRVFVYREDAVEFWHEEYNEEGDPQEPEIVELIRRGT